MNKQIIKKAVRQAQGCDVKHANVVAVVTYRSGRPFFAVGNRKGKGRVSQWSKHAEEMAVDRLKRVGLPLNEFTLMVFRFLKNGNMAMAKPCEGCQRLIKEFDTVHYTDEDGVMVQWW